MSDGVEADAAQKGGVRAVVYYGDKFVEVNEADVTLQDLSAAFELGEAVYLRERVSGRTVATLPFETVPLPSADVVKKEEDEDEDDEDMSRRDGPVVYDIIVSVTATGGQGDVRDTTNEAESQSRTSGVAHATSSHSAAFATLLQELVQLGAVELLSAELPQRLQTLDTYDETEAPGLLTRCVYPPSTYSPHRPQRDPLFHPARGVRVGQDVWYGEPTREGNRVVSAGHGGSSSAPARSLNEVQYRSSVDTYEVPDIEVYGEAGLWPSLQPLSDEERQHIFNAV